MISGLQLLVHGMAVIVEDGYVPGDRGEMVFRVGTLISGLQLLVHGSDS